MTQQKMDSARLVAARQLDQLEERRSYVGLGSSKNDSTSGDERQIRDVVAGVTRWRRYLDFIIDSFYTAKSGSLESPLRTVLRMGIYELLFTDTPDHAALNEAVELAKTHVRKGAAGLTNGILRSVLRNRNTLPIPPQTPRATHLGVSYSHPDWMVKRWLDEFGEENTIALLKHNNERPAYGVHLCKNESLILEAYHSHNAEISPSRWVKGFYNTQHVQPLLRGGFLDDGSARVQDEAAALVVHVVDPQAGEQLLDVCAAPGGKTLYAAFLMNGSGRIVAADVHKRRLNLVRKSAEQLNMTNVQFEVVDATQPPTPWENAFDKVLLDAPCSGLGVLSKRADLRWNKSETDLKELIALQRALLDSASTCVRPGGVLIYSTCSIDRQENMDQVESFLKRNTEFKLDPIPEAIPTSFVNQDGCFESLPFNTAVDGAFAARLRRNPA